MAPVTSELAPVMSTSTAMLMAVGHIRKACSGRMRREFMLSSRSFLA